MASTDVPGSIYLGLMSGTSVDGVDAALVEFADHRCRLMATHVESYPLELRDEIDAAINNPTALTADRLGTLDQWIGECFATAATNLLKTSKVGREKISAIGSHGQTIRHIPRAARPFSMQIGDPNIIAARTGITTVADFRRRDIAVGGEGAPLAPAFHQWLFGSTESRSVVINIGGMANVTSLSSDPLETIGFDTGPGNTLLDAWIRECKAVAYDTGGDWARSGSVSKKLLQVLIKDDYFSAAPPKSTGREHFNLAWLQRVMADPAVAGKIAPQDVQTTLVELTARTIGEAITLHAPEAQRAFACGGGVHNEFLMQRLRANLPNILVSTTNDAGLDPDWVEAAAFAWLASQTLKRLPGNLPTVTGARHAAVLGGVYFGSS